VVVDDDVVVCSCVELYLIVGGFLVIWEVVEFEDVVELVGVGEC